jgi:nitrogen regulatory protein P-II 2
MQLTTVRLVTIVAENVLRQRILDDLAAHGARGYSISEVHGRGTRGVSRNEFWDGQHVKIETLVSAAIAEGILMHLAGTYFDNYAVIAYAQPVEVVRGSKYS